MANLKFTCIDNKEHKTKSVYVKGAIIDITNEDFQILDEIKTKFGYTKATIIIFNDDIKDKLKLWEVQINDYLKCELGTEAATLLYNNNKVYPKVSGLIGQDKEEFQFIIKSIWINERNKPFVQLYYIHNS